MFTNNAAPRQGRALSENRQTSVESRLHFARIDSLEAASSITAFESPSMVADSDASTYPTPETTNVSNFARDILIAV